MNADSDIDPARTSTSASSEVGLNNIAFDKVVVTPSISGYSEVWLHDIVFDKAALHPLSTEDNTK